MRNFAIFIGICVILSISIIIGLVHEAPKKTVVKKEELLIPSIGSIQILNGCGAPGAATKMSSFLRKHHFDVKETGNAETWNYPYTMVISRSDDMTIAQQVANALQTDKIQLLKNDQDLFDVTVIIGPDYEERIHE